MVRDGVVEDVEADLVVGGGGWWRREVDGLTVRGSWCMKSGLTDSQRHIVTRCVIQGFAAQPGKTWQCMMKCNLVVLLLPAVAPAVFAVWGGAELMQQWQRQQLLDMKRSCTNGPLRTHQKHTFRSVSVS